MSSISIATLPRMGRDVLAALLSTGEPSNLAIVDVRDSDKKMVVFHCALSQQRGPSAALRYARERESTLGAEENQKQQVFVLEGGFVEWQQKYGNDTKLTEAYAADIWEEY
ncbi:hypothetical protein PENPOL_c003G08890 [Penicillium polonicum]|uniref:Rhodanese domain-containing protein n=1 Tax=Penicillium polonicum TaxID=60169 RepID=A0A1V6NTN7_PENPO|nr:hypothetical protein PENPOL_c003G08890 [Penicillium polonicum]